MVSRFIQSFDALTFDFVGCGLSRGEHVTLGLNESVDLANIVKNMQVSYKYEEIYLWGRSMGAVSILHMLHKSKSFVKELRSNRLRIQKHREALEKSLKPDDALTQKISDIQLRNAVLEENIKISKAVKAVVLDAPFNCCHKMIGNIVKRQANTNGLTTYVAMQYLKRSLKSNIGRDIISENKPELLVKDIDVPAAFLIGEHDELVSVEDFMSMFNNYGSEHKRFRLMVDTDHAAMRDDEDLDAGFRFIMDRHNIHKDKKTKLKNHGDKIKELDATLDSL